jgi:hypothetical protein
MSKAFGTFLLTKFGVALNRYFIHFVDSNAKFFGHDGTVF